MFLTEKTKNENSINMQKPNFNLFTIDIFEVLFALLKNWWIILIVTVVCAIGYRTYAKYKFVPKYSSSILLFVNNSSLDVGMKTISISTSDINASSNLIGLYEAILNNRTTLDRVCGKCELEESWGQVAGMISTGQVNETPIMRVTVTCDDPVKACTIAKAIAVVLPERVAEIIDGSSMRIVDDAQVNDWPVSPSLNKYLRNGALIGFALACFVIFLTVLFDYTVHSEDYLSNTYNIPLLASIPELETASNGKYYKKYKSGNKYYYKKEYKSPKPKSELNSGTENGEGADNNG